MRHKIDSTVRNDTNTINSSPVTLMAPIIQLPEGIQYTINIPSTDPDNDYVTCRWSVWSNGECAGKFNLDTNIGFLIKLIKTKKDVCMAVPFARLDNCALSLNLTNATLGMYAVALQIEDFSDENSTYAMSSVINM